MMDMSGFTALTEAYSLQGKGGTDKLSTTLSKVLVPLAERILTSRGDIVQFAGKFNLEVKVYQLPMTLRVLKFIKLHATNFDFDL